VFPAVALTQVATRVKLVEARSGYIVLNTQFPWVELHVAWVSNQWFENFAVRLFDVQLGLQQSQVVEVPMAIWPEHPVMKSALAVVAYKPRKSVVLTAQHPPNTVS
jgi:hypothetical protein